MNHAEVSRADVVDVLKWALKNPAEHIHVERGVIELIIGWLDESTADAFLSAICKGERDDVQAFFRETLERVRSALRR